MSALNSVDFPTFGNQTIQIFIKNSETIKRWNDYGIGGELQIVFFLFFNTPCWAYFWLYSFWGFLCPKPHDQYFYLDAKILDKKINPDAVLWIDISYTHDLRLASNPGVFRGPIPDSTMYTASFTIRLLFRGEHPALWRSWWNNDSIFIF